MSRARVASCLCAVAASSTLLVAHYPKLGTDFDRDGFADITLFDTTVDPGVWQIVTSRSNYTSARVVRLGAASDIPAPGDYDKD